MCRSALLLPLAIALLHSSAGCAMLGDYSPLAPLERGMVFQPVKYPAGNWEPQQLAYEDAWFSAKDLS